MTLPPLAITVDTVIFTVLHDTLQVLLVKRAEARFRGTWGLPGGFLRPEEPLEEAARRELSASTGVTDVYLEQLYTFGDPDRDTRGRVVSVAYVALLAADRGPRRPHDLEAEARWWPVYELPQVAFDHGEMIDVALERVRTKLEYTTIGFQLMPEKFTLSSLQSIYQVILDRPLDKRNFRRKLSMLDVVEPTGEVAKDGPGRPAALFAFKNVDFLNLRERGVRVAF